jgi:lipopolysaccharide/colanic/teichoic acid biosynthesis glycosyltransferase
MADTALQLERPRDISDPPTIMNKSKASTRVSYSEERSLPLLDTGPTPSEKEDNTPVVRRSLFLAWNNASRSPDGLSTVATARDFVGDGSDTGFWLLHNPLARRRGWERLSEMGSGSCTSHVLSRPWYAVTKRAIDAVFSLVLLILLLPLFALTAAAVKLDSPGPVLFWQRRVGKEGRLFLLWKFRSMYTDAPRYAASPTSDEDPRLTGIGRLIRRVSVDELPQLINVLRGEMSLVGPRPEMPFIVEGYTAVERQRLAVKPGITGLWQVSPARALPIHENLQYDLHYIRYQNLVLDGAILIRTVAAVIRGVGAV